MENCSSLGIFFEIVGVPIICLIITPFLIKIIDYLFPHNYRPAYLFERFEVRDSIDIDILAKMRDDVAIGFEYYHIKPATFLEIDQECEKYHAARNAFLRAQGRYW